MTGFFLYILRISGTKGRNKGEFTNLQGVAASSLGKVLIADSNNQCVQVKIDIADIADDSGSKGKSLVEHSNLSLLSCLEQCCLCSFMSPWEYTVVQQWKLKSQQIDAFKTLFYMFLL